MTGGNGEGFSSIGPEDIRIESRTYSLKYLYEQVKGEEITLSLRDHSSHHWRKLQRSEIIESVLIGLPMTPIYLFENESGIFHVIEGVQRLQSLLSYIDNRFKLTNLKMLPQYNGFCFTDLPHGLQYKLMQSQVQVHMLDARTPKVFLLEIFSRLNKLSSSTVRRQEFRDILAEKKVSRLLSDYDSWTWDRITSYLDKRQVEQVDVREFVLQFLSFNRVYNREVRHFDFKGNLQDFLDHNLIELNEQCNKESAVEEYKATVVSSVEKFEILYRLQKDQMDRSSRYSTRFFEDRDFVIVWLVVLSRYSKEQIARIDSTSFQKVVKKRERAFSFSFSIHKKFRRELTAQSYQQIFEWIESCVKEGIGSAY
ncbi:MAG TPA: DUF262 domain-containing protein [Bacilli bacterium]|nr:DUF262 domain-containing protein [Bacilli bacterium]